MRKPASNNAASAGCGPSRLIRAALPLFRAHQDRSFLAEAHAGMREWWALMEERGTRDDVPMRPQVPAWNLGPLLDDDAIICGDSGTVTTWAARLLKVRRGQLFSFSGTNCSMAAALPYAIGAQIAHPKRQVVAFTGDGSLTMQLGDFLTCVQYGLPIKVVVIKNNTLGLIKWEQMVFLGNPEYGVSFAPLDFVKFAEACGAHGVRVESPSTCHEQLREALAAEGPVIIEAVVDANEPPIPARVKKSQVEHLVAALRAGTPNRNRIALTMVRDMLDEASFDASPGHVVPDRVAGVAGKVLDRIAHTDDDRR